MRFTAMILTALCFCALTGCNDSSGPPLPAPQAPDAPSDSEGPSGSNDGVDIKDEPGAPEPDQDPNQDDRETEDDVTFVPEGDEPTDDRPSAPTDSRITAVETIAARSLTAGDEVAVRCEARDEAGDLVEDSSLEFAARFAPADSFVMRDGALVVVTAGQASVTCSLPQHGIVGQAARITVRPAAAARTRATVPRRVVSAGESFEAECLVEDVYGNRIDTADVTLATDPSSAGIVVNGLTARPTVAGDYLATCLVPGATDVISDAFQVAPALPARLHTTLWPWQQSYGTDDVIDVLTIVSDPFGNRISDPSLSLSTSERTHTFGGTSFRPTVEGRQTVTVRVTGPTYEGRGLSETSSFVADDNAPLVACTSPAPGSILRSVRAGDDVHIVGRFRDSGGVRQVRVEGSAARLDYGQGQGRTVGQFSSTVTAVEGLNSVLVRASDGYGRTSNQLCHFIVARSAVHSDLFLADGASLMLGPDALDDGNRDDLDSITDLLQVIMDSDLIVDEVWDRLYQRQEGRDQWRNPGATNCNHVRYNAEGVEMSLNRYVAVSAVPEGLQVEIETDWFAVDGRISARAACIRSSTNGRVYLRDLRLSLTLSVQVEAGVPRVEIAVRDGVRLARVSVGDVTTHFRGLDGDIVDLVSAYFSNRLSGLVSSFFQGILVSKVKDVTDRMVSSTDLELPASFTVPRPDGERFEINALVSATSASADARGLRLGLGTRFQAENPVRSSASGLVPVVAATPAADADQIRAAVHPGLPSQVLHALWTAGYFDGEYGNGAGSVSATTALPPVVSIPAPGRIRVSIGGVEARATLNGFGEVVRVVGDVSVEASVRRTADGGLTLVRPEVDLRIVAPDEQIPQAQIDRATRLLELYLTGAVANALASAPVAPVPSLTLPEGLPASRAYLRVEGVQIAPGRAIALDGRFVVE
jgi:hypothetical protein